MVNGRPAKRGDRRSAAPLRARGAARAGAGPAWAWLFDSQRFGRLPRHPRLRLFRLAVVATALATVLAALIGQPLAAAGSAAVAGANWFDRLPSQLQVPPLLQTTRIVAADGSTIARLYRQNRIVVPLSDVPIVARQAVLATEDARFYEHGALDFHGSLRALAINLAHNHVVQGGSSLTQQYVKNVLVQSATTPEQQAAATADTMARKIREVRYAIGVEQRMTKDQILDAYLNIVYFGDGVYGIATAARHYFNEPVQQLSLPQAALLAGLVADPASYDPVRHPSTALLRRAEVLDRMVSAGYLTANQAAAADKAPLGLHIAPLPNGCSASSAPFFCDWVVQQLLADPALGSSVQARSARLFGGGLTIRTTLDPSVQRAAQAAVSGFVPPRSGPAAAVDVVQPGTGAVKAMAVNLPYGVDAKTGQTTLNLATGGTTGFQAGSTFKIFVLAAALEEGIPTSLTRLAPHTYTSPIFTSQEPGQPLGPYTVSNAADSEAGVFNVVSATWDSVNTFYIQLEERTGLARPAEIAAAVGVRRENGQPLYAVPSFFLGTNEVSPLAMAGAYAAFAAHGLACATYGVTSVADSSGKQLSSGQPACRQAIAAPIADRVTAILQGVIDGPDPRRTGIKASIGRPAAGKTGTTENFSAAWFDGYTPQLAAAVWVGDPRGGFAHPLQNVTVASQFFTHVYGGDLPAEIWQRTMSAALAGTPVTPFHLSASAAPAVPPRRGQPAPASPVQATPPTGVPNRPPPPSPSRHHRHHHGGAAGG